MRFYQNGIKGFIKTIYKISNKTCFFSLIIPMIGLLSNIISLFGNSFKDIFAKVTFLYDANGNLTPWTRYAIISFIILSLILTIVKHIGDKWNLISDKIEKNIYNKLLNMEIGLRKQYYDKEKEVVKEKSYEGIFLNTPNGPPSDSPYSKKNSRLNSAFKIEQIIQRSVIFLSETFGCNENNINISLIYKKNQTSAWEILCKKNLRDNELDIDKLIDDDESMFNVVLELPEKYEFYINKEDAYEDRKYVKSAEEKDNGISGSIYCKNLSIYDSKGTLIKGFVLAIGTKNIAFCDEDVFQINLCKKIFRVIEDNIKREIMNLYITEYLGVGGI